MDQRIFDQLDRLERGARIETRPAREAYVHGGTEYPTYEDYATGYGFDTRAPYGGDGGGQEEDVYAVQPTTLDSFGEWIQDQTLRWCGR